MLVYADGTQAAPRRWFVVSRQNLKVQAARCRSAVEGAVFHLASTQPPSERACLRAVA